MVALAATTPDPPPLHTPCIAALILTGYDICYPYLFPKLKIHSRLQYIKGLAAKLWKPAVLSSHWRCLDDTHSMVSERCVS